MSPTSPGRAAAIAELAAERRYGSATVTRWQQLAPADAEALLALAIELRPSENQLRDLWEWAHDIATRDAASLAQVLDHEELAAVRRRPIARSDKLKLVKSTLRRLRYPQLAAAEAALAGHVRALSLPRNARVQFPEFLEGDEVRIEFVARSLAEWAATARALLAATGNPNAAAIFNTLADAPNPSGGHPPAEPGAPDAE